MKSFASAIWLCSLAILLAALATYAVFAFDAVRFPFGLDYGEGEVWQQAILMTGPSAYGDIARYPWVGFEYPPLYHLLVRALPFSAGHFLAVARLVSLAAGIICAGLAGWMVFTLGREADDRFSRAMASAIAALLVLALPPIVAYSTLARVDMLQVAFIMSGVALSLLAIERPVWLYAAVGAFLLAGFTKHTALAAPAAVFVVMGVRNPRIMLTAFCAGAAIAGALAVGLDHLTHGGFFRHLITYNIEHYSLMHYLAFVIFIAPHSIVAIILGFAGAWCLLRGFWPGWRRLAACIREDKSCARAMLMVCYFCTAAVSTLLAGKSGSSVNYFLEFLCLCCVMTGIAIATHLRGSLPQRIGPRPFYGPAALALALCLAAQCVTAPGYILAQRRLLFGPEAYAEGDHLLSMLKSMPGPVASDDLAMVLLAGKQPPIEPYLFTQLSHAGAWDETTFDQLIASRKFAAILTYKDPGNIIFDDRFTTRMAAAMLANYPKVIKFSDYRLRLPQ